MHVAPVRGARRRPVPRWAVDAGLGLLVSALVSALISADHGGRTEPDALAHLWAVGLGAMMLVRRRHPVLVLVVSVLGLFAYYTAGYPAVGVAVPIAAALLSAAEFGHLWWAIGAGTTALAASVFFRLIEGQQVSLVVGYELAGHVLLMAAAIAVGDGIRSRRRLLASSREVVALTAERAERESAARLQAERLTVARDLHDSVGHATAVISLHAEVAREAVARRDGPAATDAIDLVRRTSGTALHDLRQIVTVLRTSDRGRWPAARLADVETVIEPGPRVQLTSDIVVPDELPSVVDTTAFRIVQEAVTNVVSHSTASRVDVVARLSDGALVLTVTDNGQPRPTSTAADHGGHGLAGMRERVSLLGGRLEAGPCPSGGFSVRARIPLVTP